MKETVRVRVELGIEIHNALRAAASHENMDLTKMLQKMILQYNKSYDIAEEKRKILNRDSFPHVE